ncbi:class I adenylate-forming enzyme family protein [Microbacterium sp. NPDC058062]|uniref:class I adenylate-forming enzyme family protein n=1 Tax=Microbacterium sp. NPDC058062 TaxID=3346320 RepID=UPI0036DD9028
MAQSITTEKIPQTVSDLLEARALTSPTGIALAYPGQGTTLTWSEWDDQSAALARALVDRGLQKGDRVALLAENRIEWSIAQMGAARAGLILVPINTHSRSEDLRHALGQSGSRAVILTERFRSNDYLDLLRSIAGDLPDLLHTVVIGAARGGIHTSWDELIAEGAQSSASLPAVHGDDPAVIIYTSGTTGRPKGALLRHSAVLGNGIAAFDRLRADHSDIVTSIIPLFHSASFCGTIPGCVATGATYVGVDAFDEITMMQIIDSARSTIHVAVPTTLRAMLHHPRRSEFDLSSLRVVHCGGSDIDPDMLAACAREFPVPDVLQGYGLSEAASLVSLGDPGAGIATSSAGFPLTGYAIRIASTSTGEILSAGNPGEIQVSSAHVMIEYFRMPEETDRAFTDDGWLRTGDLGELTRSGELRMAGGRLKDMIIRGGENIYPAEIENTLRLHPAIREAAVFGVPDEALGEIVVAAVTCEADVTGPELAAFCTERIARYKAPVTYYRVDRFPLTPSNKIRKVDLRQMALSGVLAELPSPMEDQT